MADNKAATVFSCPICGGTASEPDVVTRADGTSNAGWLRCATCRRYVVSDRPATPFVPTYAKPRR